jgi:hypothetical protein
VSINNVNDRLSDFLELESNGMEENQFIGVCPVHQGRSLSVKLRENQNPLIYCFAGCDFEEVREELISEGLWINKWRNQFRRGTK